MNEANLRAGVGQALRKLWYRTHTFTDMTICPECGTQIYPKGGIPDMFFWDWQGPVGAIEFKMFPSPSDGEWERTSFSLSKITPEQRAWFLFAQETGACHLYIGLGTVYGRAGAAEKPRLAWVVPWAYWQAVEEKLLPIQRSLPLIVRPGLDRRVQDQALVATTMFSQYELEWRVGGWQFPVRHPIWRARPYGGLRKCDLKAVRARQAQIREEQREIWQTH